MHTTTNAHPLRMHGKRVSSLLQKFNAVEKVRSQRKPNVVPRLPKYKLTKAAPTMPLHSLPLRHLFVFVAFSASICRASANLHHIVRVIGDGMRAASPLRPNHFLTSSQRSTIVQCPRKTSLGQRKRHLHTRSSRGCQFDAEPKCRATSLHTPQLREAGTWSFCPRPMARRNHKTISS